MNYTELRTLSRVMIERNHATEDLYSAEAEAHRAISIAATELAKVFRGSDSISLNDDDAQTLALASVLGHFRPAGVTAAQLMVERYGEHDESEGDAATTAAAPPTMRKLDPVKTIAFLKKLNAHTVYDVDWICRWLNRCGFCARKVQKVQGLTLNGMRIRQTSPDWGAPGVDPSTLLDMVFRLCTGQPPQSSLRGRGFRFNDIREQLEVRLRTTGD